ncbi:copper chaperone PCu(A)C [Sphingomonas sp. HF-S3]|uniref:Copper chaperone PCu(A)C n=1 Tax=Sphingomonas rustica TaxID=3103142 RepID=A0ABV0BCC7_9SPHN
MRAFAGIVALTMLAACQQQPAETRADGAWVRLPAVSGNPGAAYFTIRGGSVATTLVAVKAPFAVRAELHETMSSDGGGAASHDGHAGMKGGAMSMQPVKDVAVPARGTVEFTPGGKHVMLYDIGPAVKPGERAPIILSFADGKTIEVKAIVVAAGDPAPRD